MVVTDVARMRSGVCIAGCSPDGKQSIRPVLASGGGIPWSLLRPSHDVVVEPFSVIEIDLRQAAPEAPHVEDMIIDGSGNIQIIGSLDETERRALLQRQCSPKIENLFGTEIVNRKFVRPGTGARSLGTVGIRRVSYVDLGLNASDRQQFRITFNDNAQTRYRLTVTDIAFRRLADQLCDRFGEDQRASLWLKDQINHASLIYLRIGLSRAFDPQHGSDQNCYLMATGIYTFPNYLDQTWAAYYPAE
jgi:hypothetical protein